MYSKSSTWNQRKFTAPLENNYNLLKTQGTGLDTQTYESFEDKQAAPIVVKNIERLSNEEITFKANQMCISQRPHYGYINRVKQ